MSNPGSGEAFCDLDGHDTKTLTVVQAEDGYVRITIASEERKAVTYIANDDEAIAIAKALTKAAKR